MKYGILLFILLLSASVHAQLPTSGNWLVGADVGTLSFRPANGSTLRYGALSVGKFVSTKTVVGVSVPVNWYATGQSDAVASIRSINYGIVPFVRYYLTDTKLRPYLSAGVGYARGQYKSRLAGLDVEASKGGLTYTGSVGLAYFLSSRFSVDGVVQYGHNPFQVTAGSTFSQASDSRIGASLRFQFFFGN